MRQLNSDTGAHFRNSHFEQLNSRTEQIPTQNKGMFGDCNFDTGAFSCVVLLNGLLESDE